LYVKELDSRRLSRVKADRGEREEVRKQPFSMAGGHGFGVELHPEHGKRPVAQSHDLLPRGTVL